MPHELLRTLQHLGLGLLEAQAGDPLQLALLESLGSLQLLLELLDVHLTIGEPLAPALDLFTPARELLLCEAGALLALEHLRPALVEIPFGLAADSRRLFLRRQLGLSPQSVCLASGLLEEQVSRSPRCCELRVGGEADDRPGADRAGHKTDEDSDNVRHRPSDRSPRRK